MIDNSLWNIEDLSCYLKVKVKTLYAMIREIPHYRVGKLIRFKEEEIALWIESKRVEIKDDNKKMKPKSRPSKNGNLYLDRIIRNTIDQTKQESYNPAHGKSGRIGGLMKEDNNGSI